MEKEAQDVPCAMNEVDGEARRKKGGAGRALCNVLIRIKEAQDVPCAMY